MFIIYEAAKKDKLFFHNPLDTFSGDPVPREIIILHNPMWTRELDIQKNDIMIGRSLGMSCGCPITHYGYVTEVDSIAGVITYAVSLGR